MECRRARVWDRTFSRGARDQISLCDGKAKKNTVGGSGGALASVVSTGHQKAVRTEWTAEVLLSQHLLDHLKDCLQHVPEAHRPLDAPGALKFSLHADKLPAELDTTFCLLAFGTCLPAHVADCERLRKARSLLFGQKGESEGRVGFSTDDLRALGEGEGDATFALQKALLECRAEAAAKRDTWVGGEVMGGVRLDCGTTIAQEEPNAAAPDSLSTFEARLSAFLRSRETKETEYRFGLPLSIEKSTCQDCGYKDWFGKMKIDFLPLDGGSRGSSALLEELLQKILRRGEECRMCMNSSSFGWWLVEGVWRRKNNPVVITRTKSIRYFLSLPVILPIRIDRQAFGKADPPATGVVRKNRWGDVHIPLVGFDLAPFLPPGCFELGMACTTYNLRLMVKLQPTKNEFPNVMAVDKPFGRYMGYFKVVESGEWYAFDVCSGVKQVPELRGVRRITSKFVVFLLYVRADFPLDVDSTALMISDASV
uniref:Uncharacterized protein n=1 Tax=Chromera velia CCMP2878 TaxID=1169474 RepID=A0A0G4H6D7_9ALVE|eukprot:Cvel_24863.t1-p1 / transcript=Cvel_24863.t1 / gene=Cvel_24863 / organism=Chromera_velia_CCMP2878 / gene_product=hypothetical protein / transcript_product=hypothetical protein / location=Cvel_scaffold2746:2216-3969(+) / protein_length=481 / sequence_SO=supercontig / SO=protein_coding / is_pseudo=false